jgi:hypothetical protein
VSRKPTRDPEREERITLEIVPDANDSEEQAMGWYAYLEDTLRFPFTATCIARRAISPLQVKDEVDILGMAPEEECRHEMFVMTRWEKDGLAIPLSQLRPIAHTDDQTKQAVADWHYWVQRGYEL